MRAGRPQAGGDCEEGFCAWSGSCDGQGSLRPLDSPSMTSVGALSTSHTRELIAGAPFEAEGVPRDLGDI